MHAHSYSPDGNHARLPADASAVVGWSIERRGQVMFPVGSMAFQNLSLQRALIQVQNLSIRCLSTDISTSHGK